MKKIFILLLFLLFSVFNFSTLVFANGNYSHYWAALKAISEASDSIEDEELKELIQDKALSNMIENGSIYPDGGYQLYNFGNIDQNYAEPSHWEPFLLKYMEWIKSNYSRPWNSEAKQHIAMMMGIPIHGLGDQMFDALFLSRSGFFDQNTEESFGGIDASTDACFAAQQGKLEPPETWKAPFSVFSNIYKEMDNYDISEEIIDKGHKLTQFQVRQSSLSGTKQSDIDKNMKFYPWSCKEQSNSLIPGSPPNHPATIVKYWQVLWDRLNGKTEFKGPLLGVYFFGGEPWAIKQDSGHPASWVSFAMPFGLKAGSVTKDLVKVLDKDGKEHPIDIHVYYGNKSHLVNIKPLSDWAADSDYELKISKGIESWDGYKLSEDLTFKFSTKEKPPEPPEESKPSAENEDQNEGLPEESNKEAQTDKSAANSSDDGGCKLSKGEHFSSTYLIAAGILLFALFMQRSEESGKA